ncbi:hypothetical protein C8J55DRAFT_155516 [Lentinula edodes]|uniref:F-box domain-containing protein n=1 Tax=Lentinula lateritia TaxID=40482 RepID=A0A9W9A282_9AGAR|nr:hypothetical protein C8J55DRAFT_155516 [Lentinula edodes]
MVRRSLRIQEKELAPAQSHDLGEVTVPRKRVAKDTEDSEDYAEDSDGGVAPIRRERKRSKKAANLKSKVESSSKDEGVPAARTKKQNMPEQFKKVRGKLGLLERVTKDVPMDVIIEIFGHLDPGDLLHLARTSRDLRDILMSKSSEGIWRAARRNVEGLPPLPSDLNEPQYAHLLFEPYCHICRYPRRCDNVLWNFRMRACKKCVLATFPSPQDPDYTKGQPRGWILGGILPIEIISLKKGHHYGHFGSCEIMERFKTEYEALQTEEDRKAWIVRKECERKMVREHGRLCEQWLKERLGNRADELSAIRSERKESILIRLGEIGWREEAEKILSGPSSRDNFSKHKLVKQSKKLTAHGWNSIKHELVKLLSGHKRERTAEERSCLLSGSSRFDRLHKVFSELRLESDLREPFPSLGDVLAYDGFEGVIQDMFQDENGLSEILLRSKLLILLPKMIEEWRPAKIQELVDIMQISRPAATADDLYLATTMFECTGCYSPTTLYYPQMFHHECCINKKSLADLPLYYECPWSSRRIVFSDARSKMAKTIVKACSLDTTITKFPDMFSVNALFECLSCQWNPQGASKGSRLFMRWPLPLAHDIGHCFTITSTAFDEKILACESPIRSPAFLPICCAYCHKAHARKAIVDHLKNQHSNVINTNELENDPELREIRQHWYWSPRIEIENIGMPFRYRESST